MNGRRRCRQGKLAENQIVFSAASTDRELAVADSFDGLHSPLGERSSLNVYNPFYSRLLIFLSPDATEDPKDIVHCREVFCHLRTTSLLDPERRKLRALGKQLRKAIEKSNGLKPGEVREGCIICQEDILS